jgi:predicted ATPase/transcriptional regulator with XRE-family HTH domain
MAPNAGPLQATATFADLLRQHRIAATLSQEALADRAGLSVRAISDLERGVKTRPYLETVRMLADALALDLADRAALATAARPEPRAGPSITQGIASGVKGSPLPVLPTSLVGRDAIVEELTELVQVGSSHVFTLTGPGGVGKTSLAVNVAARCAPFFDDEVYFVSLAPIRDPELVGSAVIQALGAQESRDTPIPEQIKQAIGSKILLLLLDNFEHVSTSAALVADLLSDCPALRILVTSRSPLHIRAEREYPVPPLALPNVADHAPISELVLSPAVALFVERSRTSRPDFQVTDQNASAVAEICRRLDGLPLAIELVAAWSKLLAPPEMLSRLDQRALRVTGGLRDLPDRQQTLEHCICWSYDLLDQDSQTLFRRLAVFNGGCTLEAAEAVCDRGLGLIDELLSLVDQSLVHQTRSEADDRRFGMLETIREFAAERLLADEESKSTRRSHAAYFLGLAEEAESHFTDQDQAVWMDQLEVEHDNLRTALGWCLESDESAQAVRLAGSLWQFWYTRGYFREGRRWLESALSADSGSASAAHAKALNGVGVLRHFLGDHELARNSHEEARALYERLGDQQNLAFSLVCLGSIEANECKYPIAGGIIGEALAIYRGLGNARGTVLALGWLAEITAYTGDVEEAGRLLDENLAICRTLADPYYLATTLVNRGELHQLAGNVTEASPYFSEALPLFRQIGDKRSTAATLTVLGRNRLHLGSVNDARTILIEGAMIAHEIGDKILVANCIDQLAGVAIELDEAECAVSMFAAADSLRDSIGAPRASAYQELRNQRIETAHARLNISRFDSARAIGAAWSMDQLIAEVVAFGHGVLAEHAARLTRELPRLQ